MFCMNCGSAFDGDALAACGSCGKTNTNSAPAPDVAKMIKEASSDALAALRKVASDPIAGLATSYGALGERRAQSAGLAFAVTFALLASLAGALSLSKMDAHAGLMPLLGVFLLALVPFVAFAATSGTIKKLTGGSSSWAADIFTAGVALQPAGLFFVLAAILGIDNYAAIAVICLFAWTYMLCILFTGCTRLVGLPERFAPLVVAGMLLMAMWLTQIAASALLDSSSPLGRFFH